VAVEAISLAYFPHVKDVLGSHVYVLILGVSGGIITVAYFTIFGHYFGRANLGAILAVVQVCTVLANAVGPLFLEWWREQSGSSDPFFNACAIATIAVAAAAWFVRPPKMKSA
ncbi:MAG TPA: hypothetical protein VGI99_14885, partial [Gemmataceae bacterium]